MRKLMLIAVAVVAACSGSSGGGSSQVATPTFTPAGGTYNSAPAVTIATTTAGATIYYTTDGSTPTASSPVYSTPITVSAATATTAETLKAFATKAGLTDSAVASAAYLVDPAAQKAATPTFSPPGGSYTSAQSVTISSTTGNATLYYTTDGTTPTTASTVYAGAVSVTASETLKAIATASGFTTSDVGSATYTIGGGGGGGTFDSLCQASFSSFGQLVTSCLKVNPALVATLTGANTCAAIEKEIAAGRAVYDASKASACQSAINGLTCSSISSAGIDTVCQGVLTGTVAVGGHCYDSVDCANGVCDTSSACPGTCRAYSCTNGCGPGQECRSTTQTCVAPSSAGGECPCAGGLWCDATDHGGGAAGTCKAQATSGACTSQEQCATGYACESATGTCQALVGAAGACKAGNVTVCGLGYACVSGTCQAATPSVGQSCSAQSPYCLNSFCDFLQAQPVCTAYVAAGGSCATNPLSCTPGTSCVSGVCTADCAAP